MRVIVDHCVPRGLVRHLVGHEVRRVAELGLSDADDGPVLDRIAGRCEAFVTVDQNLPYQQRLDHRPFATVILRARSNRLADLLPLVPQLLPVLASATPGQVTRVAV